ncbi:universal stress protein [Streptomyces gobitricini]|uniref:Universal stress protein n=1 Tax=Streptomyces gobitricini TaxID=68211 RepID=A0ABN3M5L4_9ACTN
MGTAWFRRLLAATDLSRNGSRAVGRAVRLARLHEARVTALCAGSPGLGADVLDQARERLAGHLRRYAGGPGVDVVVRVGRVSPTVAVEVERCAADLLVVGAHGGDLPADALLGMVPENLIRSGRAPVLVVRGPPGVDCRTVLLAVDVTDSSRKAARRGIALTPGAEHYAVHVCAVPGEHLLRMHGVGEEELSQLRHVCLEEVRPRAECLVGSLASPVPPHLLVTTGSPASAVPELAGLHGADLIVTGAGARSKWEHALLGSVAGRRRLPPAAAAEHVMRRARCDVLIVQGARR